MTCSRKWFFRLFMALQVKVKVLRILSILSELAHDYFLDHMADVIGTSINEPFFVIVVQSPNGTAWWP